MSSASLASMDSAPGREAEAFLSACVAQAKAAVTDEPDCYRFDILRDRTRPNRFHFLEIFRDSQALEDHYKTPHFAKMWQAIEPMIDGDLAETHLDLVYSSDAAREV